MLFKINEYVSKVSTLFDDVDFLKDIFGRKDTIDHVKSEEVSIGEYLKNFDKTLSSVINEKYLYVSDEMKSLINNFNKVVFKEDYLSIKGAKLS